MLASGHAMRHVLPCQQQSRRVGTRAPGLLQPTTCLPPTSWQLHAFSQAGTSQHAAPRSSTTTSNCSSSSVSADRASRLMCHARRRRTDDEYDAPGQPGYKTYDIGGTRITVSQGNLWSLALPAAMVLGLAALVGPLIIGVAMAAVAVGAAMSMGAFALSAIFWLPFVAMFGFMSLFFFPFGAFATFGLGLLLPKVMSLVWASALQVMVRVLLLQAVALGGVALGWSLVSKMLPSSSSAGQPIKRKGKGKGRGSSATGYDDGPVVFASSRSLDAEDPDEADARRMSEELRAFDRMMADRDARKRMDEWKKSR